LSIRSITLSRNSAPHAHLIEIWRGLWFKISTVLDGSNIIILIIEEFLVLVNKSDLIIVIVPFVFEFIFPSFINVVIMFGFGFMTIVSFLNHFHSLIVIHSFMGYQLLVFLRIFIGLSLFWNHISVFAFCCNIIGHVFFNMFFSVGANFWTLNITWGNHGKRSWLVDLFSLMMQIWKIMHSFYFTMHIERMMVLKSKVCECWATEKILSHVIELFHHHIRMMFEVIWEVTELVLSSNLVVISVLTHLS